MTLTWAKETDPRLPDWLNAVLNAPPFLLPMQFIVPVLCLTCGYVRAVQGGWMMAALDRGPNPQMFWNGAVCVRFMLPFCICLQLRWRASGSPSYWQFLLGWKINGRFTVAFRFEDDASAAAGVLAPNTDQSSGWNEGGK